MIFEAKGKRSESRTWIIGKSWGNRGDPGEGIAFHPCFPMTVNAYPKQCGNKQSMFAAVCIAAEFCLDATFDLNSFRSDNSAAVRDSWAIGIDKIVRIICC